MRRYGLFVVNLRLLTTGAAFRTAVVGSLPRPGARTASVTGGRSA